jgi:inositol-phosphate transport system permease protein
MTANSRSWPLILGLGAVSAPLVLMYLYLVIDTVTNAPPGSLVPNKITLEHWSFLWRTLPGRPSIWHVTLNSLVFATSSCLIVLAVSSTAGYVLSRLNVPARAFFLAGVMVLHAFPSITLIVAIFLVLQMIGLYDTLIGVIFVKAAVDMPLGIWIMKGFYDTVPWEIEIAGVQDGASRFTVWRRLVLPQVRPGFLALGLFTFLLAWSEYVLPQVLAPGNNAQVLSVYLAALIADDNNFDMALFKSVGLFYIAPVLLLFAFFQKYLMNIYGGGTKG